MNAGDRVGILELDRLLDQRECRVLGRLAVGRPDAAAEPPCDGERRMDVDEARGIRLERRPPAHAARRGQRVARGPVIRAVVRQDLEPAAAARLVLVLARHLDGRFGRLGAARRQLADAVAAGRDLEQPVHQLQRRQVGRVQRRVERKPRRLLPGRLDEPSIAVPEGRHEHAGHAIDVPAAVRVADADAVALDQHERVLRERRHRHEVDEQLAAELLELVGARVGPGPPVAQRAVGVGPIGVGLGRPGDSRRGGASISGRASR